MTSKPRLIYIEDDLSSRKLIEVLLRQHYEVLTAANGLEGLSIIKRQTPDIVLTDLNLPDIRGEMIATRIRGIVPNHIPIIAVTSDSEDESRKRAIAAGCTGYITKPVDGVTLEGTIGEYLNGRIDSISDKDWKRATGEIQADLTAQLEASLRQVREDNITLRNLELVKTAFLTQVSHELRTPLTVLSGYAQMLHESLQTETLITDTHRELSKEIIASGHRMRNLMNEVVVMARLTADQIDTHKAPFRFDSPATDAINEYAEAFRVRNIAFERQGSGWNETLMADTTLIRMAISNLLSNAIKATPNGGAVRMGVDRETTMLHIRVQDTGVGIDPTTIPLLFKPFFTAIDVSRGRTSKTQFRGMGMGIGLTIVTRIVEVHRGQVWAESSGYDEKLCPGSTFHLLLPLAQMTIDLMSKPTMDTIGKMDAMGKIDKMDKVEPEPA